MTTHQTALTDMNTTDKEPPKDRMISSRSFVVMICILILFILFVNLYLFYNSITAGINS